MVILYLGHVSGEYDSEAPCLELQKDVFLVVRFTVRVVFYFLHEECLLCELHEAGIGASSPLEAEIEHRSWPDECDERLDNGGNGGSKYTQSAARMMSTELGSLSGNRLPHSSTSGTTFRPAR